MQTTIFILFTSFLVGVTIRSVHRKRKRRQQKELFFATAFSKEWKNILLDHVLFYKNLDDADKVLFEQQLKRFLFDKNIKGIKTSVDDEVKLLVASSAVIPTFAFPNFNYPAIRTVLIYPKSFDENFQMDRKENHQQFITGMVGNKALKGTVILSKPDLLAGFNGSRTKHNVGIHEFVHLMDGVDGDIDGVPERLMEHSYIGSWLFEIKGEMEKIANKNSDINPYSLTNNAEFLAVVSEYFFSNPRQFKKKHPKLYDYLVEIFDQKL